MAHFRDSGFLSCRETSPGGKNGDGASQGTHLMCLKTAWSICQVPRLLAPFFSFCSLLSRVPASLIWVFGLPLSPSGPQASYQDSLVFSHPIDGFTKASHGTRQRTHSWTRRLVSSSSGPARARQGTSPSPSGTGHSRHCPDPEC